MLGKIFKLKRHEIAPVSLGRGGCTATDRITIDGAPVGWMYREAPVRKLDSGWRFFAGDEGEAYVADLQRHGVYDVNTIANYDPDILPFLDADVGSAFQRDSDGTFQRVTKDDS